MTLYANGLRARHHISAKNTFSILCAPAHKVQENCLFGSEGGAKLSFVPTPIHIPCTYALAKHTRNGISQQALAKLEDFLKVGREK